jgi:hypothetical protein
MDLTIATRQAPTGTLQSGRHVRKTASYKCELYNLLSYVCQATCSVVTFEFSVCRRKMRMSCLCKVEMSVFIGGQGPYGKGANHLESRRTGPLESVARGKAEAAFAGSSRSAAKNKRPGSAIARQHLGSLDRVTRIVRPGVSVATSGDVCDQPKVADGVSKLLQDVFGKDKSPCRLVYGVVSLPLGAPVELEVIFEVMG